MLTSVLVGKSSSQTYGREWRSPAFSRVFPAGGRPISYSLWHGLSARERCTSANLFTIQGYGIDFEFYQPERFETNFYHTDDFVFPVRAIQNLFLLPHQIADLYKGPGEFERLLGRPAAPSVRARHRVGGGKGARSQPNPLYFVLRKRLLGAVVQLGGARDAAAAPPIWCALDPRS
jgi:hypothetical protein